MRSAAPGGRATRAGLTRFEGSRLDPASLSVTADVDLGDAPRGTNLAPRFEALDGGRWRMKLTTPLTRLPRGTLTVTVRDREGNRTRIDRTFSIGER